MRLEYAMLTVEEVADLFSVSTDTVRRQIRSGELPAEAKMGKPHAGYLIRAEVLVDWLRTRQLEGQARAVEYFVSRKDEHVTPRRARRSGLADELKAADGK